LDFPLPPAPSSGAISNAFLRAAGSYNGLFYDTNGVTAFSSGYFTAVTTARGTFNARLSLGNRSYSFAGRFDSFGHATAALAPAGLTVELSLDLSGQDQLRGRVVAAHWAADLLADRLVFSRGNPAPQAGAYTLMIPGHAQSTNRPGGDSFGTVKVDVLGRLLWNATLADGTKVSQSSALSRQGIWPVYVPLYSGASSIVSWIQFPNQPGSDLGGEFIWMKPAGAQAKYYPLGFTNEVVAAGLRYTPPSAGKRVLDISSGAVVFSGGGLGQSFTNAIALGFNNTVTASSAHKLSLSLVPSLGLFRGSVLNPDTGRPLSFQGALFEKANLGVGFFLGAEQSGRVYLGHAP